MCADGLVCYNRQALKLELTRWSVGMLRRSLLLIGICCTASTAWGRPEHKQSLKRYYGDAIPAAAYRCATCHDVAVAADEKKLADEAPPHNAFGKRLRELGEQLEAQAKPF